MKTGRCIFALIALFITAAAFGAGDSKAAEVICSHKNKGSLKLREGSVKKTKSRSISAILRSPPASARQGGAGSAKARAPTGMSLPLTCRL